ncbi:unnamed protein product [Paramecium octaurelia]|uniref:Acyl-CoA dehydrogenase family member 11 n=2 Tax=Paramecium octaurelia TaxID=43137 RepID=A0A8S1SN06_PAROT|nr:unnamed protein product [Paramecium octaurelia]
MDLRKLSQYFKNEKSIVEYFNDNSIEIKEASQFNFGQSNPTYQLSFKNSDKKLVLRKKPDGQLLPGAHQIEREFEITLKLSQVSFPVAKPLVLCNDSSIIGTPFYVMEFVEGRIFKDIKLSELSNQEKQEILNEQARVLAQLHSIDIHKLKLNHLGKSENYYQRQIATWSRQYKLAETQNIQSMENLLYWLPLNIPQKDEHDIVCLCHGDYALNNMIFHPTQPKILAVIDWELATIGQSYADIAYMTQFYFTSQFQSTAHQGGVKGIYQYIGLPEYQALINVYFKSRNINKSIDLRYHTAFSMFRLSSIAQGVYKRALQGNASQKEQGLELLKLCKQLSSDAWELISKLTDNDPFRLKELLKNDIPRWGSWPVSDRAKHLYYRVRDFLKTEFFPHEKQLIHEAESRPPETRWKPLQKLHEIKLKAREQGLWNLFCTYPVVGKGLTNLEYSFICELMGTSIFAPEVFNCSAPDTGNMELLILYANKEQKMKYLLPLLQGEIRSCFAMTEPQVASSDATNIQTSITKTENGYKINGKKWYISGAGDERCKFAIVMGKTSQDTSKPHQQQSMILVDLPNPNVKITRPMHVFFSDEAPHGHMEMVFDNVEVPKSNLIWQEGKGFEMAQGRLGGGRLHHCMRLIGITERVLDLMMQRGERRMIFKSKMKDIGSFQQKLGELETQLSACRLVVLNAAMQIDILGNRSRYIFKILSECKSFVPKVTQNIIDEVIQIFGAEGVSQDQVLSMAFIQARTLRIADGPDEVHYRQVARLSYSLQSKNELLQADGYGLPTLPKL